MSSMTSSPEEWIYSKKELRYLKSGSKMNRSFLVLASSVFC